MHIHSDGLTTSVFTLGNEACKIKSKLKILGLIVDNACGFKDHTELVVARCKNKWRELRIHCTSGWGSVPEHAYYFIQNADPTISTVLCACLVEPKCGKTANLLSFCQSKYTSGFIQTRLLLKSYWAPHLSILFAKIYPLCSSPKYYSRETFYQSFL